jgi:hypothetical protein
MTIKHPKKTSNLYFAVYSNPLNPYEPSRKTENMKGKSVDGCANLALSLYKCAFFLQKIPFPTPPVWRHPQGCPQKIPSVYGIGFDELIMRVTGDIGIDMEDLLSSKREQKISYARGIISYLVVVKLGYNGTSLAKVLIENIL